MLGSELLHSHVFVWFIIAVLISAGVGALSSLYLHGIGGKADAGVGLSIGAAVFAVLATAQTVLVAIR